MSLRLGCIADDYTGASDLANTLTRNGLRTVQTIGVPEAGLSLADTDAVVVSLKSRSIAAGDAVAASRAAERWLRAQGATHVMFKICSTFDSTDAGNIGPVTLALQADCGEQSVLVTPAFPETGRTVYLGHLFVNGVPLHESPLKDHPLNPMRDSNLVRVLARQCGDAAIGMIEADIVAQGGQAILARQHELAQQHRGVTIIDAIRESDLEAIGAAAITQKFSVGASGLGLGLARALAANSGAKLADAGAPVGGYAACLVGSCSKATLDQIAVAAQHLPVLRLQTEKLLDGDSEVDAALDWAVALLATGPLLIASSGAPDEVTSLQERYGRERAGHAIEQAMAAIAAGLVARGVQRLVIGGGETSGAVIDRLRISAFQLGPEIAPGVPLLRSLGRQNTGMLLALKSGNFGGEDFFMRALAMME
ncbi:MAG TPA: 3-oxo-tetronate kinase [Acidocella sp.]|nr:3-oxo-tetronate kinase [Acidocella sp.]